MIDRLLSSALGLLSWWVEGLWLGLPRRLRAIFEARPRILVRVFAEAVTLELVSEDGGAARSATVRLDDPRAADEIRVLVARNADVTALLPPSIALTRTLTVPAAAASALRDVLVHEFDRLTPFAPDEIVYDYRIRARADDKLTLDIVLARRDLLDAAIARLTRLGLQPTAATSAAYESLQQLNLLPRPPLRLPFARVPVRPQIAAAALASLALALYVPLLRYESLREQYTSEVNAVREQAVAARAALEQQETALARTDFLAVRRAGYSPPVEVLLDLTRELPEHTWLMRLQLTAKEVLLQGESAAAPELLQIVESMERLQNAQFQTPVSRNDSSGKDQFTIVAAPQRGNP